MASIIISSLRTGALLSSREASSMLKPSSLAGRNYYTYVNEPAHPIPNKTPKVMSAAEAVSVVKSGNYRHRISSVF